MTKSYIAELIKELERNDSVIFKYEDEYIHIYGTEHGPYMFDIYGGMDQHSPDEWGTAGTLAKESILDILEN